MFATEPTQLLILLTAVGVVAFLYSSVGHGGATGYLAVAALVGITPALAGPGALCLCRWCFWRAEGWDSSRA